MSTSQPPPAISLDQFLYSTLVQRITCEGPKPWVDGGNVSFNMPPTGYLSKIHFSLTGTIVVAGTVTGGTWNQWMPAPFGLVKNMTLTSNQNLQIRSHSLWTFYMWLRERTGIDTFSHGAGFYSSFVNSLLGVGSPDIIPGAAITAGTYNVKFNFVMPVAYNDEMYTGLLTLQNNNIAYPLNFQCGNVSGGISAAGGSNDVINGLTGSGLSVTPSLTFKVTAEVAGIPKGNNTQRTNMFMSVIEQNFGPINGGTNVINIPQSDLYTMFILQSVNAGIPVNNNLFTNLQMAYAGNLLQFNDFSESNIGFDFWTKKIQPVNGSMIFDLGMRKGLTLKRDIYTAFNDQQVTGLQLLYSLPGNTVVSGTNLTLGVMESLRFMTQVG